MQRTLHTLESQTPLPTLSGSFLQRLRLHVAVDLGRCRAPKNLFAMFHGVAHKSKST